MKTKRNLKRFYDAQENNFEDALKEIRNGKKEGHWMWFVFPQLKGLGSGSATRHFAINNVEEAVDFLQDEHLGGNLREITSALLNLDTNDIHKVFGKLDAKKLRSSMTLFRVAGERCGQAELFQQVLNKYFGGEMDEKTMEILIEREL